MSKKHRMKPEARKEQIVAAALALSERLDYRHLPWSTLAAEINVSGAAIRYHFKTKTQLERAVLVSAIKSEFLPVIAQALIANDPRAKSLPDEMKRRALEGAL